MAILKTFTLSNEETGTIDLDNKIAEAALHPFVIKDVVVQHLAANRQGTHKTKERSDVTGSRKKLFRQKGTGNARVGSAQSPVRRGGGTVFGPKPRDYATSINKKVKKLALASVIADTIRNDRFKVVADLKLEDHKTKGVVQTLKKLEVNSVLVVYSNLEANFELASRNLQNVKSVHSSGLNVYDILKYKNVVITKDALEDVEGRLLR
ncbi:MAG: large subunit ribosomal protein L4 [bacterium]|jgi:large subunit ribosomal protein L4